MPRPIGSKNKKSTENETPAVLTLQESVDYERVIDLLYAKNLDLQTMDKMTLLKYLSCVNNTLTAEYRPSSEEQGRLYTSYGFQHLSKQIRAYLCCKDYIDIDIKNSAPSILLSICKQYKIKCPELENYCTNRDQIIEEIPDIKQTVLKQIFNPIQNMVTTRPESGLINEINQIVSEIADCEHLDLTNIKSEMFHLYERFERKYMDELIRRLKDSNIEVVAYIYDGLIVKKNDKIQSILDKVNSRLPVEFMIKPWKVPELDLIDKYHFDFEDPITFNDLSKFMPMKFNSETDIMIHILPILIKTVRVVNSRFFLIKEEQRINHHCKRIENVSFLIKDMKTPITLQSLVMKYSPIFACSGYTAFKPMFNGQFSGWSGFLPNLSLVDCDPYEYCKPLLEHIKEVWSNSDEKMYNFIMDWLAFIVQKFPQKTETLLLINGNEGTGKSMICTFLRDKIIGRHCLVLTGSEKLTRSFNAHLDGKILVALEEIRGETDQTFKHDINRMKQIITSNKIDIEKKGIDVEEDENGVNLLAFSNYNNPLPAVSGMNRRLVQTKANCKYFGNKAYFSKLGNFLENDDKFASCFLRILLDREIDFETLRFNKPETEDKQIAQFNALHDVDKSLYLLIASKPDIEYTEIKFSTEDLMALINEYNQDKKYKPSKIQVGVRLKQLGINKTHTRNGNYYQFLDSDFKIEDKFIRIAKELISMNSNDCYLDEIVKDE